MDPPHGGTIMLSRAYGPPRMAARSCSPARMDPPSWRHDHALPRACARAAARHPLICTRTHGMRMRICVCVARAVCRTFVSNALRRRLIMIVPSVCKRVRWYTKALQVRQPLANAPSFQARAAARTLIKVRCKSSHEPHAAASRRLRTREMTARFDRSRRPRCSSTLRR